MKLNCLNCNHKFEGRIFKYELGWHSICPECGSSFDVDLPEGKIIMAFTDPVDDEEDSYRYFTDDFTGQGIHIYYAFDSVKNFIQKWKEIYEKPNGMWYWVVYEGITICSGACDPDDINIFKEYWKDEEIG